MICIFAFFRVAAVETDRGLDRWLCFFRRGSSQPVRRHYAHKHSTARPPLRHTAPAPRTDAFASLQARAKLLMGNGVFAAFHSLVRQQTHIHNYHKKENNISIATSV